MHIDIMETLVQGVALQGYAWMDDFLSQAELRTICLDLKSRQGQGQFKNAGIGKQSKANQSVRNDTICWLDAASLTNGEQVFFSKIDTLLAYFNSTCFLGLNDYEFHYAIYPPGGKYIRHLDRFKNDDKRKLSLICYLHLKWMPKDGGQLRMYPEGNIVDVEPIGGRLVVFKSDELEHEVLPTFANRESLTGWLKS